MKQYDIRNDYNENLYQVGINQQHSVSIGGNTPKLNYIMSSGYDRNRPTERGNKYERISFRSKNIYQLTDKITLSASMNVAITNNLNNLGSAYPFSNQGKYMYPYARLTDNQGNTLPVYQTLRKSFIDQAQNSGLLNWEFNPIDNLGHETLSTKQNDFTLLTGASYEIIKGMTLDAKYQYEKLITNTSTIYDESSFYARNLINNYTQVDAAGNLSYPIPKGGKAIFQDDNMNSHQGRIQLNFSRSFDENLHRIDAIGGWEIKSVSRSSVGHQVYGYNQDKSTTATGLNYTTAFKQYGRITTARISDYTNLSQTTDHFISVFANAAYSFKNRYSISGSIRKDEANLFGVATNQKGTPLWSVGGSWAIDKEPFFNLSWITLLRLRSTIGYQGNISRSASAYPTALYDTSPLTGLPTATIQNPPNPSLRWERTRMLNLGVDFGVKNNILSGSIEYYRKNASDLLGYAPLDPTSMGTLFYGAEATFFGNVAEIKGNGIDINLNSKIINQRLKWDAGLIFSYSESKVSKYLMPVGSSAAPYMSATYISPVEGKPVFSAYSYKWGGLNPANGNPRGYLNGVLSEDYSSITNNTPLDSAIFHGSTQPTVFGAFRNTVSFGNLQLSFNISYKMGYYYRKTSLNYNRLFAQWNGSGDYSRRWQKEGDERITDVPSLIYPLTSIRDDFYSNSEILVVKADNIRLEDISIGYDFNTKKLPFNKLRVYLYANNLGTLWLSNADKIDPYYPNTVARVGRAVSLGLNLTL
jgi:hypothetical protein